MFKREDILGTPPPQVRLREKPARQPVGTSEKAYRPRLKTKPLLPSASDLARGKAECLQNQKLETVGLLAAGIAHDFKNLLTIISGNLEMLALDRHEPREQRKLIADAWRATDLMGHLITNLLAYMRQGKIDHVPADISLLTTSTAHFLTRLLGNGINLEAKVEENLVATVNPEEFQTVLINLVLNARDAMPRGGSVTIRVEETFIDVEAAREMRLTAGRYIAVSTCDTGTGMSTEALQRVFDSFYTTKSAGTGLGLAAVRQFAAHVGGAIRINSKIDRGTIVELFIPRQPKDAAAISESRQPTN